MREIITRFGRRNLGALWLVAEPMLFTVGVALLWSMSGMSLRSPVPIIAFAITGYSTVLLWRNTVSHCLHAIEQNLNLLYHRNVRFLDVFAARILLECGGATSSFLLLTVLFSAMGWIGLPENPLQVVAGWLLLAWFAAGLGLMIGSLAAFTPLASRIWMPVSYLLFPLSGAAYMTDWLPAAAREAALALPMVHGVEIIREGYFGTLVITHYSAQYLAVCNLVLSLLGLVLLRLAARRAGKE